MRELRRTSCANEDEADTDDDNRYGNGAMINGNRRGNTGSSRRKYDVTRHHHIRHTNTEKSLRAKRRVIRMLFVVVLEFFVCWTPVYVLQTWLVINQANAQKHVTPMMMNLFHLLSYVSSCCNPITYCFMNKKFRQGFLSAFDCCGYRKKRSWREPSSMGVSQRTGKDYTMAPNNTMAPHNTMAESPQCGRSQPVLSRLVVSSSRNKCAIVTSCMSGKQPSPTERPCYPLWPCSLVKSPPIGDHRLTGYWTGPFARPGCFCWTPAKTSTRHLWPICCFPITHCSSISVTRGTKFCWRLLDIDVYNINV